MEKILLMTDSACDLTVEDEARFGIKILNIPLTVHGEARIDRVDISTDEVYRLLNTEEELPTTAHLNMIDFAQSYAGAVEEGYNRIIYVGLNAKGSATFEASVMGKELFFKHSEDLRDSVRIYNIDSQSYSYGYGYPLAKASDMVKDGRSCDEIVGFILDFFEHRELYFSMYTLKFARRSGRINAAASFVGDMLGVRPIMAFPNGENLAVDKVRGDKNVVPKLFEEYKNKCDPENPEYVVLHGEDRAPVEKLVELIEAYNGQKPLLVGKMGACVAINAGPQIVGISFRGKDGGKYSSEVK